MLRLPPARYQEFIRGKAGAVDKDLMMRCMTLRTKERAKLQEDVIPKDLRGTLGGIEHWIEQRSRAGLEARGRFGPHAIYICGEAIVAENSAGDQNICVTMSSENLLLNAYRQAQLGLPQIVQVCVPVPPSLNSYIAPVCPPPASRTVSQLSGQTEPRLAPPLDRPSPQPPSHLRPPLGYFYRWTAQAASL